MRLSGPPILPHTGAQSFFTEAVRLRSGYLLTGNSTGPVPFRQEALQAMILLEQDPFKCFTRHSRWVRPSSEDRVISPNLPREGRAHKITPL
jgi:hypothetical protein